MSASVPSAVYRSIDLSGFSRPSHDCVTDAELLWVDLGKLVFDTRYQRDLERRGRKNIEAIAREFSWARFTPLLVSPVGECGQFAVIDGQHRAHAAALCGYDRAPAMVVALSVAEQAQSFASVNGNITVVSGFHIYRAALAAGEGWAVKAKRAVEAGDCRLMSTNKSARDKLGREVFCVAEVRRLVEQGKAAVVTKALGALSRSQHGNSPEMFTAAVLLPWFAAVERAADASVEDLSDFLDAHSFDRIFARVAELRETLEYFRTSKRQLVEKSLSVLIKDFLKKRADAAAMVSENG